MSEINGVRGGAGVPAQTPDYDPATTGAYVDGSPEAEIARIVLALEEQQERASQARRDMRQAQRQAQNEQLEQQKRAARYQAASGVIQGGAQAAGGVATGAGASGTGDDLQKNMAEGKTRSALIEGGGGIVGSAVNLKAAKLDAAATAKQQEAARHADAAEEAAQDADRTGRFQDKALSHLERINDARLQARLDIARG
ncbi:MAG: hypothetical protein ACOCUS_01775 [Polyangiales bacterium]